MQKLHAIIFILSAVLINVVGQIFIKKGLNSMTNLNFSGNLFSTYINIFLSPNVMIGLCTYFISVLLWLYALSIVDLSYAFPFLALSYIMVIIGSWLFLGESISAVRLIGVLVICIGVSIVAVS